MRLERWWNDTDWGNRSTERNSRPLSLCGPQIPRALLIIKKDLSETSSENIRCLELAQDRVQWWTLVLAVLKLCVLLLDN
jgi:hypothetical protein